MKAADYQKIVSVLVMQGSCILVVRVGNSLQRHNDPTVTTVSSIVECTYFRPKDEILSESACREDGKTETESAVDNLTV